jgi:hypothetical protein
MSTKDEESAAKRIPFEYHLEDLREVKIKLDLASDLAGDAERNGGALTVERLAALVKDLTVRRDELIALLDRLSVQRAEYKSERDLGLD